MQIPPIGSSQLHVPNGSKKDLDSRINLRYLFVLAATAALGGLLFGFDIAIITGAGPYISKQFGLNDLSLGLAFSSLLFGCVLGSAAAGRVTDHYGRRRILLWVAVIFALTSVSTGLASSFTLFLLSRFLGGVAVGGASVISPVYVAEVSPSTIRGRMGALYQLSIISGVVLSYAINFLLRNSGDSNWRWMFISGAVPAITLFLLLLRAPETPRFLLMTGKPQEAFRILERIGGPHRAEAEVSQIQASLSQNQNRWRDLLDLNIRRPVVVSFFLAILIHVSGINTIIDYAPAIFMSAGWKIDAALFSTFVVGLTNLAFTLVSFATIDRWGRRPLYIAGSFGMAAALIGLTLLSGFALFRGWLVLLLILCYLAFFASCIGPVFWTLLPEIFPNHIRGTAMTVPVLTQWIANAIVVLFFPVAFNGIGTSITFGFLAAMCVLQGMFAWRFLPETRNRSLEELEAAWTVAKT